MKYVLHYMTRAVDEMWRGFESKEHMKAFSLRDEVYKVLTPLIA